MSQERRQRSLGLSMIGVYKLAKSAVLLVGGGVLLRLRPNDILDSLVRLVARIRLDPDDVLIHAVLSQLSGLSEKRLEAIEAGIFLYGFLYLVEGVGMLLQRRWAEYLVVVTTSLLVPMEFYEVFRKAGLLRILVLLVNLAIVVYLVRIIPVEARLRDRGGPGTRYRDRGQEAG